MRRARPRPTQRWRGCVNWSVSRRRPRRSRSSPGRLSTPLLNEEESPMKHSVIFALALSLGATIGAAHAQAATDKPAFDAELAKSVGADEHGMRGYVFVLLKTGPKRMPEGPERDAMFK